MSPCGMISTVVIWLLLLTKVVKSQGDSTSPCVCLQQLVDGLYNPVSVQFQEDDVYIAEQRGVIRRVGKNGELKVILNISDTILTSQETADERGLLGFALHPLFDRNGKFFIYYIKSKGNEYSSVSEFVVTDGIANLNSERQLLEIQQTSKRGNAGQLFFGRDGFLYISVGDGSGGIGNSEDKAQSPTSFLGKILRIDVDSRPKKSDGSLSPYGIPQSNPFVGNALWKPEVFAYGCRNMWRCSQDMEQKAGVNRIFCADPGVMSHEEIDIINPGGNYGWPFKEGYACLNETLCDEKNLENEVMPIFVYNHSQPFHAVVGGYIYRGTSVPDLAGRYIYGDAMTGKISTLYEEASKWSSSELDSCGIVDCTCKSRNPLRKHILSFAQDKQGEVYVLTTSTFTTFTDDGALLKIVPKERNNVVTCAAWRGAASWLIAIVLIIMTNVHVSF